MTSILPILIQNLSNSRSASPCNRVRNYWNFAFSASVTNYLSTILKIFTNKSNSSGSTLSNKAVLNSYMSNSYYVGFLQNLIFTWSLSIFKSRLLFIKGIGYGTTWIYTAPILQLLLWEKFSDVSFFFLFCTNRNFFARCQPS